MRILGVVAGLGLLMQSSIAAAAEPREPIGKWNVDFSESQCVALLPYGEPDDTDYLVIKPVPTGSHITFAMVVDGSKRSAVVDDYTLKINGVRQPSQLLHYGTGEKKKVYRYLVNSPVRELATVNRLELGVPGQTYDLAVPQMDDIAQLLQDCMSNLRDFWNIGNGVVNDGPRATKALHQLFSSDDYPRAALRNGQSGIARVFLLVGADGDVADCTVSAYVGNIILANQTCALLTARAQFEPATDAEGKAVRASFNMPLVRWQVPGARKSMDELRDEMRNVEDANANCLEF